MLQSYSGTGIIAATPNLIERLGPIINLDNLRLEIRDRIDATSELGFGIGDEGYLLIVSRHILVNTSLLDRGARLERSLLITTSGDAQTSKLELLKNTPIGSSLKVENYIKNASRTNEVIGELGRYSLMIIIVSILLGAITIYAGLRAYFVGLEPTLRVMHLLGLTRTKQVALIILVFA